MEKKRDDVLIELSKAIWDGLLKHGWAIVDHFFKITSWTLIVGALQALYQKTQIIEVAIVGGILFVALFVGVFVRIVNTLTFVQDLVIEKFRGKVSRGWYFVVTLSIVGCLVWAALHIVFPAIVRSAVLIIDALGNP